MRITIQALVDREDGKPPTPVVLGVVERKSGGVPSSGLGLFIRETHDLLQQLQAVLLLEQVAEFLKSATCCRGCGHNHATKSTRALVYRTAFGKVKLHSPQLYSRCARCKFSASKNTTFDPLALALPERTYPQWAWLQCRLSSVMSYRLAQIFLRDAFPGGRALGASAMKATVRTIGERLEQEVQRDIQSTAAACRGAAVPIASEADLNRIITLRSGWGR